MVKRLLELFCGTKSVGKVFETAGYEVISLDYNKKFNATHTDDFLTWNYQQYAPDYFDVIWSSPDCRTWSLASGGKYRLLKEIYGRNNEHQDDTNIGTNMVLRLIEILKYFKCDAWFIENPKALLRHFPPLKEFIKEVKGHTSVVYYGNYDNWGFPKATDIWSNLQIWTDETSPQLDETHYYWRHHNHNGKKKKVFKKFWRSPEERSKIPPSLINRFRLLIHGEV